MTIRQNTERVKCCYVNVCKWRARLQCQSHSVVPGRASAAGRKPQCHGPAAPHPPPPPPPWLNHCSVLLTPHLILTKSLHLKLEIVLNVCTIRPRLNQFWSSKLNRGFIIELMIRILMLLCTLLLCTHVWDVECVQRSHLEDVEYYELLKCFRVVRPATNPKGFVYIQPWVELRWIKTTVFCVL